MAGTGSFVRPLARAPEVLNQLGIPTSGLAGVGGSSAPGPAVILELVALGASVLTLLVVASFPRRARGRYAVVDYPRTAVGIAGAFLFGFAAWKQVCVLGLALQIRVNCRGLTVFPVKFLTGNRDFTCTRKVPVKKLRIL